MALDTNLSRSPYFDTFNTDSGYHQILFRPAVAVQTRELNELQSIQQDQIAKFGRQIFIEGSVVEGCQLSFENSISYVKIIDEYANGSVFGNVNEFLGLTAINSANVSAIILNTYPGGVAKTPDLNTLFVRYTQASDTGTDKFFTPGEQLTLYTASGNPVGNVVVANTTISGATPPIGFSYIVHAQEGVIFQKGFFIRAEPQSYVLSKYSSTPDGLSVGYTSIETIDTPESNTQLLDNASGAPNYSAPGAHRLKLTPVLTSRATQDTTNTSPFFSIVDFAEGQPSVIRTDPSYSRLGKQLAERTYDESGNYIINPFIVRLGTKYDTNGDIVANQLKLEIEKGLAYINGYRVETVGKLINSIRRGTDTKTVPSQTVTTAIGSYVFVKEFAGIFDPTSFQQVSLRNGATQAITSRSSSSATVGSLSPAGVEIGTANIIGVEYDHGSPGTSSCVYRVYLTNIVCSDFSKVKSIYAVDLSSREGHADIELSGSGLCVLQDVSLQTLTFQYNQKAIKTLFPDSIDLNKSQFDFKAIKNRTVSSTGTATIPVDQVNGGNNFFPYSTGQLSNIQERDFIITYTSASGVYAANIAGHVTASSGSYIVTGYSTKFTSEFSNGNIIKFSNGSAKSAVTDFKYRRIASVDSDTQITLVNAVDFDYGQTNIGLYLTSGDQIGSSVLPNTTITITNETTATLALNRNFYSVSGSTWSPSSFDIQALYNVRRATAKPLKKKLNENLKVKIDTATATKKNTGPWCLGIPDVYKIKSVYVGANYGSLTDKTSLFVLDNGQRDTFYDLANIGLKTGASITPGHVILVEFDAFIIDNSVKGYISIDSYPVDDTGISSNTILTQNIPVYNSSSSGKYDLRNTIDFRVRASNTATATNVTGDATVNPPKTISIDTNSLGVIPVPEASFQADLEYYVGRYDKVGLDSLGNIKVVEGAADETPIPPTDIPTMMTLALVKVPPYPSLAPSEAASSGRYDISTDISYYKNRRYTMKDISILDRRIENLEYYTSLSTLELSTKSLLIKNETGGNRFQFGLLADSFRGHDIGSTTDPQYRIAVDYAKTEARPMVEEIKVDLKYNANTGHRISENGRLVSLYYNRTDTDTYYLVNNYISQPFASQYRNVSQDVTYIFNGHVTLYPEGDWMPAIEHKPDLNINLDLYSNFATIADAIGTIIGTYRETSKDIATNSISSTSSTGVSGGTLTTTVTTDTTTEKSNQTASTTKLQISEPKNTQYNIGEIDSNIALQPWVQSKKVEFFATGLKPNAILTAFFDDTNVTQYCKAFTYTTTYDTNGIPILNYASATENSVATLKVAVDGSLKAFFNIPEKTFYAGERLFRLVDVDNLETGSQFIQTQAAATYFATNLSYASKNVALNTTTGQLTAVTGSTSRVVTTTKTSTNFSSSFQADAPPANEQGDPILQTFSVNEPDDISAIFIDSIDLYFFKKDLEKGIRIEIREMFNGFPGYNVVPFSSVHLNSSSVNISSDASVKTRFIFPAPILLENKKDYAIRILADGNSPDYAIWTAEQGQNDVKSKSPIFKNSAVGVMFTSSDNKTWTPYQKEDIKFGLTRINFVSATGDGYDIDFTNDDTEYLTANNLIGPFDTNEKVYFSNSTPYTGATSASPGSTATISGLNSTFVSSLSQNDLIYVRKASGSSTLVRQVVSASGTSVVVNSAITFGADAAATVGKLSGNGGFYGFVKSINYSNNYIMIGNSTANSTVYMKEDHLIIASTSGSSATIKTINEVKYNVITPKFAISTAPLTGIDFSLRGYSNTLSIDSGYYNLIFAQETPFFDKERKILSKSKEIQLNGGLKTLSINAKFRSDNIKLTPLVDMIKAGVVTTYNIVSEDVSNSQTQAITIQYIDANGAFNVGDPIYFVESDGSVNSAKSANIIYSYTTNTTHGTIIANYLGGSSSVDPSVFTPGSNVCTLLSSNVTATMRYVNNSLSILATEKAPGSGTAKARYISKKVVLADTQDAEDLKVYVAAYKPAGTDIYVFAKFWNGYDPESFDIKQWTQLTTDNTLVSSKANVDDFIEYEYNLPTGGPVSFNITANTLGVKATSNTIVVNNIANNIFKVGDKVYYEVPDGLTEIDSTDNKLAANAYYYVSFANNTAIALSTTLGGANIDITDTRTDDPGEVHILRNDSIRDYTAFLNSDNNNTIRYYNRDGSTFDTYKAYSVKIVLLSNNSSIIPRLQDFRAIAVSAF